MPHTRQHRGCQRRERRDCQDASDASHAITIRPDSIPETWAEEKGCRHFRELTGVLRYAIPHDHRLTAHIHGVTETGKSHPNTGACLQGRHTGGASRAPSPWKGKPIRTNRSIHNPGNAWPSSVRRAIPILASASLSGQTWPRPKTRPQNACAGLLRPLLRLEEFFLNTSRAWESLSG